MYGSPALRGDELTDAISASMVKLYARHYDHDRTTGTTYINDNVVLCLLEDILSTDECTLVGAGDAGKVIDGRVAFQIDMQDEFTAEIERLTQRHVTAFLSANQTTPGVACELFFLEAPPAAAPAGAV
jgi:Na+-translocating membrane potential-generating system (MpsC)